MWHSVSQIHPWSNNWLPGVHALADSTQEPSEFFPCHLQQGKFQPWWCVEGSKEITTIPLQTCRLCFNSPFSASSQLRQTSLPPVIHSPPPTPCRLALHLLLLSGSFTHLGWSTNMLCLQPPSICMVKIPSWPKPQPPTLHSTEAFRVPSVHGL